MSTEKPEAQPVINSDRKKEDSVFTKPRWPPSSSSRRTPSLSSTSSSNSSSSFRSSTHELSPPPSPEGGIPFSWETIPGIPKKRMIPNHIDSSRKSNYLPLPPAAAPVSSHQNKSIHNYKKPHISGDRRDPFFAALVECSKNGEGDDKGIFSRPKSGRSFSLINRFVFGNLSCKNASVVAESLVFIPRSPRRIIAYDRVKNRSG